MGFDLERFVCELSPSLKCPICCKIFENPVQVDCVGGDKNASHIFCRSCLIETFASSDRLKCPIDGKLFKRNTRRSLFLKPPQELFDTLSSLPIKCSFPGCLMSVRLADLESHAEICQYNPSRQLNDLMDPNCMSFLPQTSNDPNAQMSQNQSWFMDIEPWNPDHDPVNNTASVCANMPNSSGMANSMLNPMNMQSQVPSSIYRYRSDLEKLSESMMHQMEMKLDERFNHMMRIVAHENGESLKRMEAGLYREIDGLKKWRESTLSKFDEQLRVQIETIQKCFPARELQLQKPLKKQRVRHHTGQEQGDEDAGKGLTAETMNKKLAELKSYLEDCLVNRNDQIQGKSDEVIAKLNNDVQKLHQELRKDRQEIKKIMIKEVTPMRKELKRFGNQKVADLKSSERLESKILQVNSSLSVQIKELKSSAKSHDVGLKNVLNRVKSITNLIESEFKQLANSADRLSENRIERANDGVKRRKSSRLSRGVGVQEDEVPVESSSNLKAVCSSGLQKEERKVEVKSDLPLGENNRGAGQEESKEKPKGIEKTEVEDDLQKKESKNDLKDPSNVNKEATIGNLAKNDALYQKVDSDAALNTPIISKEEVISNKSQVQTTSVRSTQSIVFTPTTTVTGNLAASKSKVSDQNGKDTDLLAQIVNEVLFKDNINTSEASWPSGQTRTTFVRPLLDARGSALLRTDPRHGSDTILLAITRPVSGQTVLRPVIPTTLTSNIRSSSVTTLSTSFAIQTTQPSPKDVNTSSESVSKQLESTSPVGNQKADSELDNQLESIKSNNELASNNAKSEVNGDVGEEEKEEKEEIKCDVVVSKDPGKDDSETLEEVKSVDGEKKQAQESAINLDEPLKDLQLVSQIKVQHKTPGRKKKKRGFARKLPSKQISDWECSDKISKDQVEMISVKTKEAVDQVPNSSDHVIHPEKRKRGRPRLKPLIIRAEDNQCENRVDDSEQKIYVCEMNSSKETGMVTRLRSGSKVISKKNSHKRGSLVLKRKKSLLKKDASSGSSLPTLGDSNNEVNSVQSSNVSLASETGNRGVKRKAAGKRRKSKKRKHETRFQKSAPLPVNCDQQNSCLPDDWNREVDGTDSYNQSLHKSDEKVHNLGELMSESEQLADRKHVTNEPFSNISQRSFDLNLIESIQSPDSNSTVVSSEFNKSEGVSLFGDELNEDDDEFKAIQRHLNSIIDMIDRELESRDELQI